MNHRESQQEAANYITSYFKAKECSNCQALSPSSRKSHLQHFQLRESVSNVEIDSICSYHETNAFGTIEFLPMHPGYQKKAKYIRLADDTEPEQVLAFMKNQWKLLDVRPDLVISVIGGGKHLQLADNRKKEIFNQGLVKAIHATRGWIFTFGFNYGIGAAVGAAVHEGQAFMVKDNSELVNYIQCIGITPWGCVKNRDDLKNPDLAIPFDATYYVDNETLQGVANSLEPNHSHFLLVDDGHRNRESGTAEFRLKLETEIASPKGENIPVVCVLVEGGIFSVQSVCDSLSRDLPVVICKGTDRAADILANCYAKCVGISQMKDKLLRYQKLSSLIEKVKGSLTQLKSTDQTKVECEIKLASRVVTVFMEKQELINIFDISKSVDLDISILFCLMHGRQKDNLAQLILAQKWNRADVARNHILKSCRPFRDRNNRFDENFNEMFMGNLVNDRVEFLKLFIDKGFNVAKYLTVNRLRDLYRSTIGSWKPVWNLMKIPAKNVTLANIHALIRKHCNRRYHQEIYEKDTGSGNRTRFSNPFCELFIWAVIMGRYEMALYLWEQCYQPLLVAVTGTLICHKLGQSVSVFSSGSQIYKKLKGELEVRAIGLIDQANETNAEKSLELIGTPHHLWGGLTVLDLAALSYGQNFVATQTCQTDIWSTWKKGFEATGIAVVFCTFVPFAISSLVTFLPRNQPKNPISFDSIDGNIVEMNLLPTESVIPVLSQHSVDSIENMKQKKRTLFVQETGRANELNSYPDIDIVDGKFQGSQSYQDEATILTMIKDFFYRMTTFYTSPVVKFTLHTVFYILFLSLYTYVALFSFRPTITTPEICLQCWIGILMLDELRALLQYEGKNLTDKINEWWSFSTFSTWNVMDLTALVLAVSAFSLRHFLQTFAIARLIFSLNFIVFISRSFKVYFVNSYLGPKVVMIKRMVWDLVMFLLVVVVFLLAYSVSSQSLLYPHREFYKGIFWDLFNHGIWELFGELQDEPTNRSNFVECNKNDTNALPFDCDTRWWPVPLLLAAYLFAGNVLMMNLLIATFAHVFEEIQSNSEQIWKHEMYFIVEEYKFKPFLPPPFIILSHIWILICFIACSAKRPEIPKESEFLAAFERVSRADYLYNRRKVDANLPDNLILSMGGKLSELETSVQMLTNEIKQLKETKFSVNKTEFVNKDNVKPISIQSLDELNSVVQNKLRIPISNIASDMRMSTSLPQLIRQQFS